LAKSSREKCQAYRWGILNRSQCVDCGETNPILLDFDHVDSSEKVADVSTLVRKGCYNKLVAEIPKCEIRCTSCHRLSTAMEAEYYSDYIDWSDPEEIEKYMKTFKVFS
jgi:hypothetical protein